ncbi:hypothetical protein [Shivajiella indica]|uniref:Ferritin-like domain-containing protein n=1 Tax=Shivajiella indica TaxID=872115 RepID=A0ABW5B958_9BACT
MNLSVINKIWENKDKTAFRSTKGKERPEFYITPTHDFTQYTKDCEEKYYNKDTAFDWSQNVGENLKDYIENLPDGEFARITFMVLPMIKENIERKIYQIEKGGLPLDEDAMKDIAECIPFDKLSIFKAIYILSPLKKLQYDHVRLEDQMEILQRELLEVSEQQRLGFFKKGEKVKSLETENEKKEQAEEISRLKKRIAEISHDKKELDKKYSDEEEALKDRIQKELDAIDRQILLDLKESFTLLEEILTSKVIPKNEQMLARLKDLIWKRQFRGLKDLANHSLVVEQTAIAPLSMGIIHYKRYREIQEAMTTFINDEAKHSAIFRRFLVEKLEAKEYVSDILIKGAEKYMWLARFMPATGMFLAVIVEVIGASYLEFFGHEKYMPDKLFRKICQTISMQDEKRHMDLCVAMYNELFRKGTKWERMRNQTALKVILKAVYGDKSEDHHLIQAFRAFGVESEILYRHIITRLSEQLARVGIYEDPDKLLEIILGKGVKLIQPLQH